MNIILKMSVVFKLYLETTFLKVKVVFFFRSAQAQATLIKHHAHCCLLSSLYIIFIIVIISISQHPLFVFYKQLLVRTYYHCATSEE